MEPASIEEHRTISLAEVWDEEEAPAYQEKAIETPVVQRWTVPASGGTPHFSGKFFVSPRKSDIVLGTSIDWTSMIVNALTGAMYPYNLEGYAAALLGISGLQHNKAKAIGAIRQTVDETKKHLLALKEDWDGDGAPAYQEETIEAAADFLYELVEKSEALEATQVRILPASEGSIDMHWKSARFELLVNFHPDGSVSYYGDDYCENSIQGKTRPSPGFIACWMDHTGE